MSQKIDIKNRKASYEYTFIEKFVAGLQLKGSEIKSIRDGKALISDAHCLFSDGELIVKGMHIAEYKNAGKFGHEPTATRKLLLTRKELQKLADAMKNKGLTIIPLNLFINQKGWAKLEIALAKGKKVHDKRESIKKKDAEREIRRHIK